MSGGVAAPAAKARYRLSFTEEMNGFFAFGEADYQSGFDLGRAAGSALKFHLTIDIDDTYAFISDPTHLASAAGDVKSDALGGACRVERGLFNLFLDAGEVHREPARHMRYRLWFRDAVGHPLTLSGLKDISHPAAASKPSDVWRETTTLYVRLSSGFVEEGSDGEAGLVGAGILHISPLDFVRLLSTFRVDGPGVLARCEALGAFGGLFVGQLWDVFRPRRPVPAEQ